MMSFLLIYAYAEDEFLQRFDRSEVERMAVADCDAIERMRKQAPLGEVDQIL